MASFFLAPDPIQSTFLIPGGVVPGNGVQLFIYVAGSVSTKTTVYKDNAGNTAWSNPIVLDSGGNLPNGGVVWIPGGVSIKAVWAPSNDTDPPSSPYRTIDNISGINDASATQSEWSSGPAPTFVSGSQFTLAGDQTTLFTKARRLKFTVTAGTVYGTISSVSFVNPTTTVNVAFASGALDAGLSAVSYSLLAVDNPSVNADYINKQSSTVPSSGTGTTNIWGVAGASLHITGTNTIANFSSTPYSGAIRDIVFDGVLTLTHNATNLSLPGGVSVTTAVGDSARVYADGSSTKVIGFQRANGLNIGGGSNLVFISSTQATASSSIDSGLLPSFQAYRVLLQNILPSTTVSVGLRYSSSGAGNFDATNVYSYAGMEFSVGGAIAGIGTNSDSRIQLMQAVASTAVSGMSGELTFQPFVGLTPANWNMIGVNPTANVTGNVSGGRYGGIANAIRIFPAAGTISGTVIIFGMNNKV